VKTCPLCGASYGDDDAFCEVDGAALGSGPESGPISAAGKGPSACEACGAPEADDGDGYCSVCGHRLVAPSGAPSIPSETAVGTFVVLGARGADDFHAKDRAGRAAVLAVGAEEALALEAAALDAFASEAPSGASLPRTLDRGGDARWGAFLALSPVPEGARRLADVGPRMPVEEALAIAGKALDVADRVERAGYDWLPLRDDLYLGPGGELFVARLRGARRLAPSERLDARAVSEAVGGAFLPEPGVRGSARVVRFFSAHTLMEDHRLGTIEAERKELRAIVDAGVVPPAAAPRPRVAYVCDPGMKRGYNEDAGAVATGESAGERWAVLVVCDGVSSSTHADQASLIASKTACDTLAHFAKSGDIGFEAATQAVATAVRAAHIAICAQRFDHGTEEPPGTTIVAALIYRKRLTVGWVGDSRAYWISSAGGELLTHDHSWVNETVARGEMSEAEAQRQPLAHALTRCLGPLEVGDGLEIVEPDVRIRDLPGPGCVVLCSDGLWNYFTRPADLAGLFTDLGKDPATIARVLVNHALARGGHDNVTVAVYAHD
jgi:serine/threonine protein phosphatase PrpC